jgi:hypothetical protein
MTNVLKEKKRESKVQQQTLQTLQIDSGEKAINMQLHKTQTAPYTGVPGGMCQTSGECPLC